MDNYKYWTIQYTAWGSSEKSVIARTPQHWTKSDLRKNIEKYNSPDSMGIICITEIIDRDCGSNYTWDYE